MNQPEPGNYTPSVEEALALLMAFEDAANAGLGFRVGTSFHAIPGLEDAAADFIEARMLGAAS